MSGSSAKTRMAARRGSIATGQQQHQGNLALVEGSPEWQGTLSPAEAAEYFTKQAERQEQQAAARKKLGLKSHIDKMGGARVARANYKSESDDEGPTPIRTISEEAMTGRTTSDPHMSGRGALRSGHRRASIVDVSPDMKQFQQDQADRAAKAAQPTASTALNVSEYGLAAVLGYVKSFCDCAASEPGMLDLCTGDVLAVTADKENGWLAGFKLDTGGALITSVGTARSGWFSEHCVKRVQLKTETSDGTMVPVGTGLHIDKLEEDTPDNDPEQVAARFL
jgi:hypothetical protein